MNTIKKLIFLLLALPVLLTGCDKNFDKINTSPNATTSVPSPYIMTYAERQVAYLNFDVWNSGRQCMLASQQWAQRNYTSEDRYLFRQSVTDAFFRNNYILMQSFQDIINLNTNADTKGGMAAYGDNAVQIATAQLMKIWLTELMAETFGDVPYTEANQPTSIVQPKYDKQSELFPKLLADAATAVAALKTAETGWTQGDVIFGGDLDKWVKFGNSLRLRLLVRMSNVRASWKADAAAVINDGVMTSNDDNAMIQFLGAGAPNEAPMYNGFIVGKRNDFTLTKQFVLLLEGQNNPDISYTNPFAGLEDPRFKIYVGDANYTAGKTTGVPYGMSDAQTGAFVSANSSTVIDLRKSYAITSTFPVSLLDYPTVCFMKSEVNNWDRDDLEAGIRASLEMWGADVDESYIAGVLANYDAATTEGKKEIVLTQKYIHLYMQGFEAWAEYRRTGYPKSLVKPNQVTNGTYTFITANDTGGKIVPRLMYDSNEYTLNKANVSAAATSIGGDTYATKLWWAL